MYFVDGQPKTRKLHDLIWVIVDRMNKSTHFIPVKSIYKAEDYAMLYIDDIVKRNGIPLSIISEGEPNLLLIFGDLSKRDWVYR